MQTARSSRGGRGLGLALAAALAVLGGAGRGAAQQAPAGPTVTLEEAVARALEAHPQLARAGGAVRSARAGERTAVGSFLPSVSLSTGSSLASSERFDPQTNTSVVGSSDSYRAGLTASVDLFTAGRRGADLARARSETHAAEAGLVERRYAVVLETKRAFFDVARAEELIAVAGTRLERAREVLQAAQRRLDVGSATTSDVLRARLELSQAEQSVLEARTRRADAAFALGRLVGAEGAVGVEPAAVAEPEPLSLGADSLLASIVADAPVVRAADAAVRSGEAGVRSARTQYLPSLRLSSGYDWFNSDPVLAQGRTSWSVGLGVSYPVFNGFQREASLERARVEAHVAEMQLADARRAARADAERVLGALELARERMRLTAEAVAVAEEDLRVQRERYRVGASTMLDLLASQTGLRQAETDRVTARFDYQLALAELESLAGREL